MQTLAVFQGEIKYLSEEMIQLIKDATIQAASREELYKIRCSAPNCREDYVQMIGKKNSGECPKCYTRQCFKCLKNHN